MTVSCPQGHASATSDYCDQCGAKIDGSSAGQITEVLEIPPADVTSITEADRCPDCGAPNVASDRFCEGCGYDFETGTPGETSTSPAAGARAWEAVLVADRAYFDRVSPGGIEFPADTPAREIVLDRDELRIGRGRGADPDPPDIDLASDPAVSRLHATLVRQEDGSYAVVDQGSTNGTRLNDEPEAIEAGAPVPVADGDRIHVGVWTTITLRLRPS